MVTRAIIKLGRFTYLFWLTALTLCGLVSPQNLQGETNDARKGMIRLLSAEPLEQGDYHFRTSIEYFQRDGLLKDIEGSKVESTRATLAIGYSWNHFLQSAFHLGSHFSTRTPQQTGTSTGSEAINLVRTGFSTTAHYDLSSHFGFQPGKISTAFSLWVDFSKISRFLKGPNIIPTLVLSTNQPERRIPFAAHTNFGFQFKNSKRYFDESASVKDFERFGTQTFNSWALTSAAGVEFPFRYANPSLEFHLIKAQGTGFSSTPKWITLGLKGNPFPQRNIEVFAAGDIGLSTYKATATTLKPNVPVTPLWNIVLGFGISRFGIREGQVSVSENEYRQIRNQLAASEETLRKIRGDLEYHTIQGRIVDSTTKLPLPEVTLSFPEIPDSKPFLTGSDGRFLRYMPAMVGARLFVTKEGYESTSKFLSLRAGERVAVDIELKKELPGQASADFVATFMQPTGTPAVLVVKLTHLISGQTLTGTTDENGQIYLKVPVGAYQMEAVLQGYETLQENISFEKGKTILKSYTLRETIPEKIEAPTEG